MRIYHPNEISEIIFELKNGKAAIVQTDTVMGIISYTPSLIYKIKQRHLDKKLIIFVPNLEEIIDLELEEKKVLKRYLPGPLTVIKKGNAYRVPKDQNLLKLLNVTGPIYSSSANLSGKKEIDDYKMAINIFSNWPFELIVVKGKNISFKPSTIIDLDHYKVIREGEIDGYKILNEIKGVKK